MTNANKKGSRTFEIRNCTTDITCTPVYISDIKHIQKYINFQFRRRFYNSLKFKKNKKLKRLISYISENLLFGCLIVRINIFKKVRVHKLLQTSVGCQAMMKNQKTSLSNLIKVRFVLSYGKFTYLAKKEGSGNSISSLYKLHWYGIDRIRNLSTEFDIGRRIIQFIFVIVIS